MTIVAGVVQPDYDECGDAPVGNVEVPGPEGPPGDDGPPGTSKFPFIFVFGDGITAPQVGAKIAIPVPTTGAFVSWQARVAGDVVGTVVFALRVTATPTGALAGVGGTQPSLTAVKGNRVLVVDWTTQGVVAGGVLECEYVSGDGAGVTLSVEYE